jgi:hypothetical protein
MQSPLFHRFWIVIRVILCAVLGFGAWVTQAPPDEAVVNACKWFTLFRRQCPHWVNASNIPDWTPLALSAVAGCLFLWIFGPSLIQLVRHVTAKKIRPYISIPHPVDSRIALRMAFYFLTDLSEWQNYARKTWFANRHHPTKSLRVDLAECMSEMGVLGAAIRGELKIFGRMPDAVEFEPIHRDNWKLAHFEFTDDPHVLLRVKPVPWDESNRGRLNRLLSYDELEVEIDQFTKLWPKAREPLPNKLKVWWTHVTRKIPKPS